eukprot:CAMPEP_0174712998 /NCGR_PEP_ID=MMETSP1094-20130205/13813_1 /TAXON_ID=156173 /ORGANISM="Chrysochromulina brevifilum, Strain UTEX LB 985" /LENGTH=80 /DNA_ID=CAMNT_0015912131 /DNA_START=384 /DNA_END=623 /DNA_ORIENTATION=-
MQQVVQRLKHWAGGSSSSSRRHTTPSCKRHVLDSWRPRLSVRSINANLKIITHIGFTTSSSSSLSTSSLSSSGGSSSSSR